MNSIKVFCPATVANVSVGYDVLGFCLESIGDIMTVTLKDEPGISISEIHGFELPLDPDKNVAGLSALALYKHINQDLGFDIKIEKRIKPGSGIGSSAASAVGSVYAINELLNKPFSKAELIEFALAGESFASGSRHADNLAPCLYGGFSLVRSLDPIDIIELPSPADLYATIIHPQIEVKTSDSRSVVPDKIELKAAINQWAELGSFIHGLHTSDYDLISRSLTDHIVEEHRSRFIPYFSELKEIAMSKGVLGFGIAGSGPSLFMLSQGAEIAKAVETAFKSFYSEKQLNLKTYVSLINNKGISILEAI